MGLYHGFWSYVHDDDSADGGRIKRLANDIVDQYQMQTGEKIQLLFLDKDEIKWGDEWRNDIDSNLASVAFFIPVITPRYFMSPECRRELQLFLRKASDLGVTDLILPLHYVDVPALYEEKTEDELINLLRNFQWEDWRELRFSDVESSEYRRGVSKLAARLVEANKLAEDTSAQIPVQQEGEIEKDHDDTPGLLDILATAEDMIIKLPVTLRTITDDIVKIGEIVGETAEKINKDNLQGRGFSVRLITTRQAASKLIVPVDDVMSLSNLYASQLHSIDSGFRIIIERAPIEIKETPDHKKSFCDFFDSIYKMFSSSNSAIESIEQMIDVAAPLEKMSRDLRPVLRRLNQGLTILIESSGVIKEWVQLIETTGIVCDDL